MSESSQTPIQITVGYDKVSASWIDGDAIWLSDYYPHERPDIEALQLESRRTKLAQGFNRYKLLDPTVEIIDADVFEPETDAIAANKKYLRVTTLVMPYIDVSNLRPIMELRQPAPTAVQANDMLVIRGLVAGGQAIFNEFGSAMTQRRTSGNG